VLLELEDSEMTMMLTSHTSRHQFMILFSIRSNSFLSIADCVMYRGDNNVLLQQASNWLLTIWANPNREELRKQMPLNTLSFLSSMKDFNRDKFKAQTIDDLMNPEVLLKSYKWLICYLLKITAEKFNSAQQSGKDAFTAKNDSQVYAARTLSIAFMEHYSLESFWTGMCQNSQLPQEIRQVLVKLLLLYGLWSLEKHLAVLYQGGYAQGPTPANIIRDTILELCGAIKPECLALVDAIAPPDFVLNSALGHSDGQIYKNLQQAMMQTPNGFERDSYWKDIVGKIKSKL